MCIPLEEALTLAQRTGSTKAKSPDAQTFRAFLFPPYLNYERTYMDFTVLPKLIKALGEKALMELLKSKWIKFSIGLSLLFLTSQGFIRTLAEALK